MRIAVIGAGGVGGTFGAKLAAAGHEVAFAARGVHREAMAREGLVVTSPEGEVRVAPLSLLDDTAQAGRFDIVLVTVKMYDLEAAAASIAPLLGPDTAVIPVQNGVEAADILARRLPREQICGGVARIGAAIEAPGRIRVVSPFATLLFGALDGSSLPQLEAFAAACAEGGVDGRLVPDIELELWRKFAFLAPFAAVTAFARAPIGAVREDPVLWQRFLRMVDEAAAVARARGVALPEDFEAETTAFARQLPAEMSSSMANDLAVGRRLELDWLTGAVVRLGAAVGVDTPESARVYEALAPLRNGAAGT